MKIYLVEKDNGETYEDYHTSITGAFTSFRSASESLIKKGFKPYLDIDFLTKWYKVSFALDEVIIPEYAADKDNPEDYGYDMSYGAEIIEIELQNEDE